MDHFSLEISFTFFIVKNFSYAPCLSHCSIAVRRHHGQDSLLKKAFNWELATASEGEFTCIVGGSVAAGRHSAAREVRAFSLICRQEVKSRWAGVEETHLLRQVTPPNPKQFTSVEQAEPSIQT